MSNLWNGYGYENDAFFLAYKMIISNQMSKCYQIVANIGANSGETVS